jgi:hypothetical protein
MQIDHDDAWEPIKTRNYAIFLAKIAMVAIFSRWQNHHFESGHTSIPA